MVGGESVLKANLEVAGFADAGIGKRQRLLTTPNGTRRFLLPVGIAASRLCVLLKQHLLAFAVAAGGLYGGRADLADDDLSAAVVGFGALVGLVRAVLKTKHLHSNNRIIQFISV